MFAVGRDHFVSGAMRMLTPNVGHQFGDFNPNAIIIHYTAGTSAAGSLRILTDKNSRVSAHFVIGRDGTLYQLAPCNRITWHAGVSEYLDTKNFNARSIGIELDNAGALQQAENGNWVTWNGITIDADDVIKAKHKNSQQIMGWHKYSEEQLKICTQLCRAVLLRYGIRNIFGHDEVAPNRKLDPGPAFPMNTLRRETLGHAHPTARVAASRLNIRRQPHVGAPLADDPLPNQQRLEILELQGDWAKVRRTMEGWVAKRYLGI